MSIPEPLQEAVESFLSVRPDWDRDRVLKAALSLFLLQNEGKTDRAVSRIYIDSLFNNQVES